jgi:predicted enzyme related to lactoylglutathione lyase
MPTIVHYEIPVNDIERSKKFYGDLFGWKIEKWSGTTPAGEYWMITMTDEKGNRTLGGGIHKRMHPDQRSISYIGVKSVEEHSSKVEKLGGKVVTPKMTVPGLGYFVFCLDSKNNNFAIWESDENAK